MNVNEVIAIRAAVIANGSAALSRPVHPNDHVNMAQSSNDIFPSAMHVAAVFAIEDYLLPALSAFQQTLEDKAARFADIVKIGRTHLQDATPLTLGQEMSGWAAMVASSRQQVQDALGHPGFLAIGGTAVGTGLNVPAGFGEAVAQQLSRDTGKIFYAADNKFHALTIITSAGLCQRCPQGTRRQHDEDRQRCSLACQGPRCGLGEIVKFRPMNRAARSCRVRSTPPRQRQ